MRMNLTARLVEHTDVVNQYLKAQTPVVKIAEANGRRIPHKKDSVGSMPQISVFMPQVDLLRFYFSKHTIPSIPVTCLDGRSSWISSFWVGPHIKPANWVLTLMCFCGHGQWSIKKKWKDLHYPARNKIMTGPRSDWNQALKQCWLHPCRSSRVAEPVPRHGRCTKKWRVSQ